MWCVLYNETVSLVRIVSVFFDRRMHEGQVMKLRCDLQLGAAYVTLDEAPVAESEQVRPDMVLDLDGRNRVVGIEIPNVRCTFPQADVKRLELELA